MEGAGGGRSQEGALAPPPQLLLLLSPSLALSCLPGALNAAQVASCSGNGIGPLDGPRGISLLLLLLRVRSFHPSLREAAAAAASACSRAGGAVSQSPNTKIQDFISARAVSTQQQGWNLRDAKLKQTNKKPRMYL